jgi:nitrate reductase / nitrite oxidoreductase, beta subunit
VMLYDADGIAQAASVEDPQDLYQAQLDIFLDPDDPAVQAQARADGVPEKWLEAARRSPAYKMAIDWKIAFPLHPEYRTLPMVWYVPPLSPINARVSSGKLNEVNGLPDVRSLRIPVRYLANLLTAGKEEPVVLALERLLAMRAFFRERQLEGTDNVDMLKRVGLSEAQAHEMHRYLAIADYEDRFVIPTTHREYAEDAYDLRNECGFSFGNGCSSEAEPSLFGGKMGGKRVFPIHVRGADGREKATSR